MLPDKWNCAMNTDPAFNSCTAAQERLRSIWNCGEVLGARCGESRSPVFSPGSWRGGRSQRPRDRSIFGAGIDRNAFPCRIRRGA